MGSSLGEFKVSISGAIEVPYFVLGKTTDEEWNSKMKRNPAPWAEFEVPGQIIITVPSYDIQGIKNLTELMSLWNETMNHVNFLAGFHDKKRPRAERMVFDVQIFAGYMHSGYPIMGQLKVREGILDYKQLKTNGSWGFLHALGHNHQYSSWNVPAITETTSNLWPLYVHEKMFDIKNLHKESELQSQIYYLHDFALNDRPPEKWTLWTALTTYVILKDIYGWDPYIHLFKKYMDQPPIAQDVRLDTFARMFSEQVKENLCPYFEWFRFPLSKETLNVCNKLAPMQKDPLEIFRHPEMHKAKCPRGWIAYGEKTCFHFSADNLNWLDAVKKCSQLVQNAQLASCLTPQEAGLLSYYSKVNDFDGYIGLIVEHGSFANLDGTAVSKHLPLAKDSPTSHNQKNCGILHLRKIKNDYCDHHKKFVCKTGPTLCPKQSSKRHVMELEANRTGTTKERILELENKMHPP